MAKTRLLASHKETLWRLANTQAGEAVSTKAIEDAYASAVEALAPIINAKYPPCDMKVLRKYEAGRIDKCVRCAVVGGGVIQFEFKQDDAPYLPRGYCSGRNFAISQEIFNLIDAHHVAIQARQKEVGRIVSAYGALIEASRYVEDILEAWPGAKETCEPLLQKKSTALTAMTDEAKAIIKNTKLGVSA